MGSAKEVKEGYSSTLQDLTFNSKPLINVLTMLADENSAHAKDIVEVIESYLQKVRVEVKLPVLYLIDCIMKNVGEPYTSLFCQNLVSIFCTVFEMAEERIRAEMFKLRQTWNEIIPSKKLFALDVQIRVLDHAWPLTAPAPTNSIHVNPKFFNSSSAPPDPAMDSTEFDLQKKLLIKQQELLELQQKKLKLELLQAQVKLSEEKMKNKKPNEPEPKNVLLKPEVAKQLAAAAGVPLPSRPTTNKAAVPGPKQLKAPMNSHPKINPVNSALVNTARPSRDPRLLRHQSQANANTNNSSVISENKSLSSASLDNKVIVNNNKANVREGRIDPRLANNSLPPSQGKARSLPRIPKLTNTIKNTDPTKTSSNKLSSRKPEAVNFKCMSNSSPSKKTDGDKSASSPSKSSSSKNKKKDSPLKSEKKSGRSSKPEKETKSQKNESHSPSFKDIKGNVKNRNYVRRNREHSISPEVPHDVDLRIGPPEKLPRLQGEFDKNINPVLLPGSQGMDIDLRTIPEGIGKKRLSTETVEVPPAKKSKSELMDELFGNEDTDLRQLNVMISPTKIQEKPCTPPPPIISDKLAVENKENNESPKGRPDLDFVRAKLANATRDQALFGNGDKPSESSDFRNDRHKSKIFISAADENGIKSGSMTPEQKSALMKKIMQQIEEQKLQEAKRKEKTENQIADCSFITVSDEETDRNSPIATDGDNNGKDYFKEHHLPPTQLFPPEFNMERFPKRMEHMRPSWRGRGGRPPLMPPGLRPPLRGPRLQPWARPMNPTQGAWRPMMHGFMKPMNEGFVPPSENMDQMEHGNNSPHQENSQDTPSLIVSSVNQDNMKCINIDGIPRDIRYYDETAVALMNWDDPREISFHDGSRRVVFDEKDSFILNFNDTYRDVFINGNPHRVRLGAPTREIYIDGNPYECFFGGPSICVELDGKVTGLKMEGPPPQVKIGPVPRTDLVGGKINLIIDAKNVIPIYLDAKVQKFEVDGKTHTLQFTDALRTVLLNDMPYAVEFGGLPKPFVVDGNKHFIRFSVLPKGIKPGYVNIKDMKGSRIASPVDETSQEGSSNLDNTEPALPVVNKKRKIGVGAASPDHNSNSSFPFQNVLQQPSLSNLDVLSSVMSTFNSTPNASGYSVGSTIGTDSNSQDAVLPPANPVPSIPLNINELFQKLVATGIVTTLSGQKEKPTPPPPVQRPTYNKNLNVVNVINNFKPVYFDKPETLKLRQHALIQTLHTGMQCSSCGMRFPLEHSKQYSQHLDWHFRQNRKGKKSIRKAASRRWYYNISDWKNYEEVEDVEEKEKNFFDQQQAQSEGGVEENEEEIEIPSVVADPSVPDARCELCLDKFEQFYNEDKEEWHLRMAIRSEEDNKTYHPLCYEDYMARLQAEADEGPSDSEIPGLDAAISLDSSSQPEDKPEEIVIDDDDEDNAQVKNAESEVSVEKEENESEQVTPPPPEEEEDDDDDVIINEVVPEKIILDDDDGNDEEYVPSAIVPKPVNIIVKQEPIDDGFVDVGEGILKFDNITIKTEPLDTDESMLDMSTEDKPEEDKSPDVEEISDALPNGIMEGNMEFASGLMPLTSGLGGKIKINISKSIPVISTKDTNKDLVSSDIDSTSPELIDPSQPLPPGEENIQLNLKPALQGLNLKKLPPVKKGVELTGLCSIM